MCKSSMLENYGKFALLREIYARIRRQHLEGVSSVSAYTSRSFRIYT